MKMSEHACRKEERCSNCLYNKYENKKFYCENSCSDLYEQETGYNTSCEFWEKKGL